MPYPNEYAARIHDPSKYKSIHRENNKFGEGIDVIWGTLPDGKTEVQAIRFSKGHTSEAVHAWLKAHDYSPIEFSSPTNKDGVDFLTVCRHDTGTVQSFSKTPEGYIKGTAKVTRTGVFNYMNKDGSKRRELRHPHEVFALDSLPSMKMIPITNGHPATRLVTADTAKELQIGYTGENIQPDGQFILAPIVITDAEGVRAVEAGRRELSLGYEVDLEEVRGDYDGEGYDAIQRNIRYNHLAIVDRGRAGEDVRIALDAADAIETNADSTGSSITLNSKEHRMVKVMLDGLEYESAPEVVKALEKATAQINEFKVKADAAIAAADVAKAKADSATDELTQLKGRDVAGEIATAVSARIELERKAGTVLDGETVKTFNTLKDDDIRKAVIVKVFPNAKLDSVTPDYLLARFDAAMEVAVNDANAMGGQRKQMGIKKDGQDSNADSSDSRKKYVDRLTGAYKGDACGGMKKEKE